MKFRIGVTLGCVLLATAGSAVPVIDNTPTRVQTPLRANRRLVGTLKPKPVGEISTSRWTVDCAGMDREHVDWRSIREYAAPLGIARMRQQAGWARCEKDPGRYDFAWLDQAVFDAKRMGISTWLELSYGNPAYKGGGGRQLGAGFPTSEEGLAAWDRWVEKIVTHYKGTVRDFCVWNEPDLFEQNDPAFAVGFAIRTAEIIKRIEPEASIAAFALSSCKKSFVEPFVRELARRGKAQLFTSLAYFSANTCPYIMLFKELRRSAGSFYIKSEVIESLDKRQSLLFVSVCDRNEYRSVILETCTRCLKRFIQSTVKFVIVSDCLTGRLHFR